MSDDRKLTTLLGELVCAGCAIAIGVIYGGWVLCVLWGWFAVPLFGLQALTIAQGIGVRLVASYLTPRFSSDSKQYTDRPLYHLAKVLGTKILWGIFTLTIGWIVKHYIGG